MKKAVVSNIARKITCFFRVGLVDICKCRGLSWCEASSFQRWASWTRPTVRLILVFCVTNIKFFVEFAKINHFYYQISICRAHRNDMENILPSLIVGLIYVLINPSQFLACTLFKVAGLARILHTIVYAVVRVPQPARALSFAAHFGISIYMGLAIVHKLYWWSELEADFIAKFKMVAYCKNIPFI